MPVESSAPRALFRRHWRVPSMRIPVIALLPGGDLLAVAVARRRVSDFAATDIVLRRSTDGGESWTRARRIVRGHGATVDNPTLIVDDVAGVVHLLHQVDYGRVLHRTSTDGGRSFGEPTDITAALAVTEVRDGYTARTVAPGPGLGARLASGRLLAPIWVSDAAHKAHAPSQLLTLQSDDRGATWQAGPFVVRSTPAFVNPSEAALAELPDGRVLLSFRHVGPSSRRGVTWSSDGGDTWSPPVLAPELFEPVCQASLAVVPWMPAAAGGTVAFVNPDSRDHGPAIRRSGIRPRERLTLRLSPDGGSSWGEPHVLDPGRSAYSSLVADPARRCLHLLYESTAVRGHDLSTAAVTYRRLTLT